MHVAPAADKVLHLDLATFGNLEAAVKNWGLIPAEFARHYGLTFITSFFLHGGLVHLIGNVAVFAHLGGADAGVVFWLWTRRSLSMDTAPPLTEPARTI